MSVDLAATVAAELSLARVAVERTLALFAGGATVPFIARYRKEAADARWQQGDRSLLRRTGFNDLSRLGARSLCSSRNDRLLSHHCARFAVRCCLL